MVAVIWIDPEKCQFLKISLHIYFPCSVSYEYILTASHFNNIDITLLFFVSKLSEKFWITEFILFITAFSFCSKELKLHPDVNSSLHFLYFPKSPTPNHIPMESWIPVPLMLISHKGNIFSSCKSLIHFENSSLIHFQNSSLVHSENSFSIESWDTDNEEKALGHQGEELVFTIVGKSK